MRFAGLGGGLRQRPNPANPQILGILTPTVTRSRRCYTAYLSKAALRPFAGIATNRRIPVTGFPLSRE